jgi:hypothetical protein
MVYDAEEIVQNRVSKHNTKAPATIFTMTLIPASEISAETN